MSGRFVSLVLIVAVIACPMSCSKGRCHGKGRGHRLARCQTRSLTGDTARSHTDRAVLPACPCGLRGCGHSSPTGSDAPCRCPGDSCCQGVCGGAVVERTCVDDVIEPGRFVHLIDIQPATTPDSPRVAADRMADVGNAGARNAGRFARTLYQSLLI